MLLPSTGFLLASRGDMQGTECGSMNINSEEVTRQAVKPNGEYSDASSVDAIVVHHGGAVEVARMALENTFHEEIDSSRRTNTTRQR